MKSIKEYPVEELNRQGIKIMTIEQIYDILEKVERANMKKYHSSIQVSAAYKWITDRCMLRQDGVCYVFVEKFKDMVKQYGNDEVHSPWDLKHKPFDGLMRLFLEGNVSEC